MQDVTFIGGKMHGETLTVGPLNELDIPSLNPTGPTVRYLRKTWSHKADPMTGTIASEAYFVLSTLSDKEASDLIIKHIKTGT